MAGMGLEPIYLRYERSEEPFLRNPHYYQDRSILSLYTNYQFVAYYKLKLLYLSLSYINIITKNFLNVNSIVTFHDVL